MEYKRFAKGFVLLAGALVLAACGQSETRQPVQTRSADEIAAAEIYGAEGAPESTIWDIFKAKPDAGRVGAVNKYIWNASLQVLDFLPVESVDPFTGVITTGYGTPPGGGTAYRATILVSDPALDARSLNVALMTRSGPASASAVHAVEDAILTRARQLRAVDSKI
ncbi:DUF3576 domain-containing protein [Alloyangia pacifica]|uniref:DUF3576 domain-containing protein n=1 Tax=Alloyangia pacifica TaxID=311180 RepID=A0A1I6U9V9_9RHOB|nr:DUF3576 domain-containing protein [Alloyangia pacifica]SDH43612.1 protein of unknown function [Alloyangia pacifica]SFS98158.1 protein of unknown function [Alloyangia pacifica]